jgi:hypothetical protein
MRHKNKHTGCLGDACPICPKLDLPGYEVVRALLSAAPYRPEPCVRLGEPTGETRACKSCKGSVRLKLLACGKHGACTTDKPVPGVACCRTCPDRDPPAAGVINQGASGLGDALSGLCSVNGYCLENPGREIVYKVAPAAIPFAGLFDVPVMLAAHDADEGKGDRTGYPVTTPGEVQLNPGYDEECQSRGVRTRWRRNLDNLGVKAAVRPGLRDESGLRRLGADYAGAVLLAPFSMHRERDWPLTHWRTLARLLRAHGYRAVILDSDHRRHQAIAGEKLINRPAAEVAGAVLAAGRLIGNDSGLVHLGAMLGVRTLALCGQTGGQHIYGFYGDHVTVASGHLDCGGCWWQPPFDRSTCAPTCPNLASITPQEVLAWVIATGPPVPPRIGETGKAHARRQREGWYAEHCRAPLLDVGCNNDFLLSGFPCTRWDQVYGDGDATYLAGVPDGRYQTVYASHILEHVHDPQMALRSWWRVLRPGGKLIICVPARDLYEGQKDLPSRFNSDHKTYWVMDAPLATDPRHTRGLRQEIVRALPHARVVSLRTLDEGYACARGEHPQGEFSLEAILEKP